MSQTYSVSEANILGKFLHQVQQDLKSKAICAICHEEQLCPFEAFPLLTGDEKVCQACSYFVRYSNDLKQYKADVLQVLATLKEVASRPITQSIQFCLWPDTPHLQIQFTEGLHAKIPENKYLQYACGIVAFFITITTFVDGDASITVSKDFVLKCPQPLHHLTTLRNALRVSLINQNKTEISTFRMKEDGTIYSWLNVRTDDRALEYLINQKYSRENGFFELNEFNVIKGEKEIKALDAEHPYWVASNDTGRMLAIRIVGTPRYIPVDDVLWRRNYEAELAEQKRAEAKKEQKRKERALKEKKEREREEMRQYAIQQKEKEEALRLARASLVSAVAKVDEQLETIRKLRELNREVALKNQKLADRKEADRLAKEAEKRHAEKLKQKELERLKFISKKN